MLDSTIETIEYPGVLIGNLYACVLCNILLFLIDLLTFKGFRVIHLVSLFLEQCVVHALCHRKLADDKSDHARARRRVSHFRCGCQVTVQTDKAGRRLLSFLSSFSLSVLNDLADLTTRFRYE